MNHTGPRGAGKPTETWRTVKKKKKKTEVGTAWMPLKLVGPGVVRSLNYKGLLMTMSKLESGDGEAWGTCSEWEKRYILMLI